MRKLMSNGAFPTKRCGSWAILCACDPWRSFSPEWAWFFSASVPRGLDARFHFQFTGLEKLDMTVSIRDQKVAIERGLIGERDVLVRADSETWLGYLARERSLIWALLTRRVRVRGSIRLLQHFERCFAR